MITPFVAFLVGLAIGLVVVLIVHFTALRKIRWQSESRDTAWELYYAKDASTKTLIAENRELKARLSGVRDSLEREFLPASSDAK